MTTTTGDTTATTLVTSTAADDHDESVVEPPARLSIVDRFLEVRGLERKKEASATTGPSKAGVASRGAALLAATLARNPSRTMWHAYTKRHQGERVTFARRAMRTPDESYSDSADVYSPKKHAMAFIKIHEDADDVSRQFLYRTRSLIFEREVVDRPVCDLMENQAWYDHALDRVHAASDDDDDDGAA